jgi:hypothetical protein
MSMFFWAGIGGLDFVCVYGFNKWNNRHVDWAPEEVVKLLDSWINDDVDYKAWDYFEACKIADPRLEAIRLRAIEATWLNSPYVQLCGERGESLNEQGKELFKELKAQCM